MLNPYTIKKEFPIFQSSLGKDLSYLDSASTSQTPECVIQKMDQYYREFRASTRRGQYAMALQAEEHYEGARQLVARMIEADEREIIFTGGATASMNLLLYMLQNSFALKEGDEIITSVLEHHSILIPLQEIADRLSLSLKFIPLSESFELDLERGAQLITEKTKLVVLSLASNVLGTVSDLNSYLESARDAGALSIIDAAQAAGHIPISVKNMKCDFLFFSGHKMCGPTGIGVLYARLELLEKLSPGFYGGGMVDDVTLESARFALPPWKFEAGTPNISGAIGLGEACRYLGEIGIDNIFRHSGEIVEYALIKLGERAQPKLYTVNDPAKNIGVVSFAYADIHAHDVAELLTKVNVAVRAGHHCALPLVKSMKIPALSRASFYLYTTNEDVDALLAGLEQVDKIFDNQQRN